MKVLFDFEFTDDAELNSRLAEILLHIKGKIISQLFDFEDEIKADNGFIIYTWNKDVSDIVYFGSEGLANNVYSKFNAQEIYEYAAKKYKSRNMN